MLCDVVNIKEKLIAMAEASTLLGNEKDTPSLLLVSM